MIIIVQFAVGGPTIGFTVILTCKHSCHLGLFHRYGENQNCWAFSTQFWRFG